MVATKILEAVKWSAETVKGTALVLAHPNAPVPASQLHPRMMARPWTAQEYVSLFIYIWEWLY